MSILFALLAFVLMFGLVFLFFSLGAHSFPSGAYRKGGYAFALVLTVIFMFAAFWSAAWGKDAWPAFFVLVVIAWLAVKFLIAWNDPKNK